MNPDTYRFESITEDQSRSTPYDKWKQFRIGEILEINGVRMRVRKITNKDIVLRPVREDGTDLTGL